MTGTGNDKSRLERLLEIGVYAPVGFLITRSQTVPDLAKAGRRQIAFARSLGQVALKGFVRSVRGDDAASKRPAPAASDTESRLERPHASEPEASVEAEVVDASVVEAEVVDASVVDASVVETAASADVPTTGGEVEGYDEMTAKEIVDLIKSASLSTLVWIQEYESAHKRRVTVERAVARALG